MPDVADLLALVQSLRTITEITESVINAGDARVTRQRMLEFQEATFDTQGKALATQTEQTALLDEVRRLNERVRELESWKIEKDQDQLTWPSGDTLK
jgi:hypothetical protein